MLVNNGLLYVILRHLGNFVPVARGEMWSLSCNGQHVKGIQLPFTNPFSQLDLVPDSNVSW